MKLPTLLDSKEVFRSTKFTVVEDRFQLATGEIVTRAKLGHVGAAVIVPTLPDGRMVLIEQYRYALQQKILEFPAGTRDDDEDFLVTAKRELKEEVGGLSEKWTRLSGAFSTPGFTDEMLHTFLAEDVVIGENCLEQGELVEKVYLSATEVEEAISSGRLCDMKSIVAFYLVKLHRAS